MSTTEEAREALDKLHRYSLGDFSEIERTDIPGLVTTISDALAALPETPTTDDRDETTDEALWDFATDLLDAWNIEDLNPPGLVEQFRDMFVRRFRRPSPPTEEQWEYAVQQQSGYVWPLDLDDEPWTREQAFEDVGEIRGGRVVRRRPAGPWEPMEAAARVGGEA